MTSRRKFIQSSLVVSALSLTELNTLQAAIASPDFHYPDVDQFIFDNRFEEAVHFSQLAAGRGLPLLEFSGDLTELWSTQLSKQWKQGPRTLAGVTDQSGLFILETLAADYEMKVVQRKKLSTYNESTFHLEQSIYSWLIEPRSSARQRA